jgi:hypothetical protein
LKVRTAYPTQFGGTAFEAIKLAAIICASGEIATLGMDETACIRCSAAIGSPDEISSSTNAEM